MEKESFGLKQKAHLCGALDSGNSAEGTYSQEEEKQQSK